MLKTWHGFPASRHRVQTPHLACTRYMASPSLLPSQCPAPHPTTHCEFLEGWTQSCWLMDPQSLAELGWTFRDQGNHLLQEAFLDVLCVTPSFWIWSLLGAHLKQITWWAYAFASLCLFKVSKVPFLGWEVLPTLLDWEFSDSKGACFPHTWDLPGRVFVSSSE